MKDIKPVGSGQADHYQSVIVIDGGKKLLVKGSQGLTLLDAEKVRQGASVVLGIIPASEGSTRHLGMAVLSADKKTLFVEVESGLAIVDLERLPLEPLKN